jgi:DNA-binding MurR/RpiR family transcriptional regulator
VSTGTLVERVQSAYGRLSPGHRRVVDYLLAEKTTAVFLTAEQLAARVGTSASTVIRCAAELGYRGLPELRRNLQALVSQHLGPADRLDGEASGNAAAASLQRDLQTLHTLADELDHAALGRAADLVEKASRVFVRGARSSEAVAGFLALSLGQMRPGVAALGGLDTLPDAIADVGHTDVLIAVALPRYTQSTVTVARFFSQHGAPIIAVTDSHRSPLARVAEVLLPVPYEGVSFFNSNVAATALANALLATLAGRRHGPIHRRLERREVVWRYFRTHTGPDSERGA